MMFVMMSEGLREMVWNTASAYVEGFDNASEAEQDDILDGIAETLVQVAEELGYDLDTATCAIEGIEDADELVSALTEIEHELDGRY